MRQGLHRNRQADPPPARDDVDTAEEKVHGRRNRIRTGRPPAMPRWQMTLGRLVVSLRSNCGAGRGLVRSIVALLVVTGILSMARRPGPGAGWRLRSLGRTTTGGYERRIRDGYYAFSNVPRPDVASAKSGRSRVVTGPISDLSTLGYEPRPLSLGYYFQTPESSSLLGTQRLDPHLIRRQRRLSVSVSKEALEAQLHLTNSKDYYEGAADPFEEMGCVAQYEWQKASYPTCNKLHEVDLSDVEKGSDDEVKDEEEVVDDPEEMVRLIASGYWRDVWMVRDADRITKRVLKTIRYQHDWEERNYERHRRDALASERLTSSPRVVDVFGYCGNSALFEHGDGGDVDSAIWPEEGAKKMSKMDKLKAATDVAMAIADMHNFDKEGTASVAHTDITPGQFILIDGVYKLNDFNRCRFIRWNTEANETCGFEVGNNPGKFRSPEEYKYEIETEKIDIYSMGNIFYSLLTESWPFEHSREKKAQEKVKNGDRPPVDGKIKNSTDPVDKALLKAMEMCYIHDPDERATAREIANYLSFISEGLEKVKKGKGWKKQKKI